MAAKMDEMAGKMDDMMKLLAILTTKVDGIMANYLGEADEAKVVDKLFPPPPRFNPAAAPPAPGKPAPPPSFMVPDSDRTSPALGPSHLLESRLSPALGPDRPLAGQEGAVAISV